MTDDLQKVSEAAFEAQASAALRFPDYVTPSSRPVAWFGDTAAYGTSPIRIVTVGLNPSQVEFPVQEPDRRFPAGAGATAANAAYRTSLDQYFGIAPYCRWFNTYRTMLEGLDASFDGNHGLNTALHTDLCSPVPTSPTWSRLPLTVRAALATPGVSLWHDLLRALRPHVALLSVAREHLDKIAFTALEPAWRQLHTIRQRRASYEVSARRYDVGGSPCLFVWGRAANTPFGSISYSSRREIGVLVRHEVTTSTASHWTSSSQ